MHSLSYSFLASVEEWETEVLCHRLHGKNVCLFFHEGFEGSERRCHTGVLGGSGKT